MIDAIAILFFNGYTYVKKHPQLLMTLVLIVVIPVAFLLSGQQFLSAAKENQESLEKERIGLLHDVFIALIKTAHFDTEIIQSEIENITNQNPDIVEFTVVRETGNDLQIIASLEKDTRTTIVENPIEYRSGNIDPNRSLIIPEAKNGIRYWKGYRLLQSDSGEDYYLYTKTSLAHIDTLFSSRIVTAYYWLLGILAIVLLLVVRHVRLIDYAYLYTETKKANEMKDLFTNMIAHELRAPLTAMRGYASLIVERAGIDADTKMNAQRIEESAGRLVLIVNDLLDVARIHSGKLSIKNATCNVHAVITGVTEAMQSSALEKNIKLTFENMSSSLLITIDEKRLYQALTNLVSNSIKYTKAGAISLSVEEKKDRIEIRVKDTGMGISAENQKNLFAPFFRVENIETNQTVGTGLGMWITKQLIELMKGSIGVESIKGVGTHIVVTLPK